MSQKLLLRKAQLADAVAIAHIYITSRKKFVTCAPLVHSEESINKWVHEILIPTYEVIIAEKDSIVGMMAI